MRPIRDTGILGFGGYVPMHRIAGTEVARAWRQDESSLPVREKAVPGPDEDTLTIAVEAAMNAIARSRIDPQEIQTAFVGTESKPYAVKPTGTILVDALGLSRNSLSADLEFACKAGTEGFQVSMALVSSGMVKYAMAVGVDVAQSRPADELEFTSGAGGGAFIFGLKSNETVAYLEGSTSYVSDTPDFWRRPQERYPQHAGRFTGEPAYFHHIRNSASSLMNELGLKPSDFDFAVFHQPNTKFPIRIAASLGIGEEKLRPGLLSPLIGNAYAGIVPLGLCATLEQAKPDQRILVSSFGSGAGSDSFSFIVQDAIDEKRDLAPKISDYVDRKLMIDYVAYAKCTRKILR